MGAERFISQKEQEEIEGERKKYLEQTRESVGEKPSFVEKVRGLFGKEGAPSGKTAERIMEDAKAEDEEREKHGSYYPREMLESQAYLSWVREAFMKRREEMGGNIDLVASWTGPTNSEIKIITGSIPGHKEVRIEHDETERLPWLEQWRGKIDGKDIKPEEAIEIFQKYRGCIENDMPFTGAAREEVEQFFREAKKKEEEKK